MGGGSLSRVTSRDLEYLLAFGDEGRIGDWLGFFLMNGRVYLGSLRCYDRDLRDRSIEDNLCVEVCWNMAAPVHETTSGSVSGTAQNSILPGSPLMSTFSAFKMIF